MSIGRRDLRDKVKASRLAPVAALPMRAKQAGRHNYRLWADSARWLFTSREHENFTYDLTGRNRGHLAWFVAHATGAPVSDVRGYLDEVEQDEALRGHLERLARAGTQPGLADKEVRYGRRIGWYALVRATRPQHVVETGTDKGLGTCVLAAALLRNGSGRLTTIDVDPAAGHLIAGPYGEVTDLRLADSVETISGLDAVDFFIHDSDHSAAHERAEIEALAPRLSDGGWVLSDNAHVTSELADWAERTGRGFLFFDERPAGHWYAGGGIGVALPN